MEKKLFHKTKLFSKKIGYDKAVIEEIQKETQRLFERMKVISFKSKKFSEIQMASDQRKIAILIVKLIDTENSMLPDTRKIDRILYNLCDELQIAYKNGDSLSAHYIIEALCYGIVNGHKTLTANERKREAEVIQWHEKNLDTYLKIVQTAQNKFYCNKSVEEDTAKLKNEEEEFEQQIQELMKNKLPLAYEPIVKVLKNPESGIDILKKMEEKLFELEEQCLACDKKSFFILRNVFRKRYECTLLKKHIRLSLENIESFQKLIFHMEMDLNQPMKLDREKLMSYMKREFFEVQENLPEEDVTLKDKVITKIIGSKRKLGKEIQIETQKLSDRMKSIVFKSYKIPEEQINEDQRKVERLIAELSDADSSVLLDTRKIDCTLYDLCDELQEAYRKGDALTAHYIIGALAYGIVIGHKLFAENERTHEKEMMRWCEKNVETYCMMIIAAQLIFSSRKTLEKNIDKLKEKVELFRTGLQEYSEFLNGELSFTYESMLNLLEDSECNMESFKKLEERLSWLENESKGYLEDCSESFQVVIRIGQECIMLKQEIIITKMDISIYQKYIYLMESRLYPTKECEKQ